MRPMLLRIAEQTVAMDLAWIDDPLVDLLTAPFRLDRADRVDAQFAIPATTLEAMYESYPADAKARFEFMAFGSLFSDWMLRRGGFCLHASAIAYRGKAYLFAASSGTGKSTHARLWTEAFPGEVRYINDDRPIVYCHGGVWTAYGAPWCGKDDLGANIAAPIGGICYLMRGTADRVRRIRGMEAFARLFSQVPRPDLVGDMDALIQCLERVIEQVPVYELTCMPTLHAAMVARDSICCDAEGASI